MLKVKGDSVGTRKFSSLSEYLVKVADVHGPESEEYLDLVKLYGLEGLKKKIAEARAKVRQDFLPWAQSGVSLSGPARPSVGDFKKRAAGDSD